MSQPQRISLDPSNPVQGQEVEICYDFSDLQLDSTRLRVTFEPESNGSSDHEVSPEQNCVTVSVPSDAESIQVEDLDGPSPDKTAAVQPG